jgi:hypothetical protein
MCTAPGMIALAAILALGGGPARGAEPPRIYVSRGYHRAGPGLLPGPAAN